jgi:hypothetical protein
VDFFVLEILDIYVWANAVAVERTENGKVGTRK